MRHTWVDMGIRYAVTSIPSDDVCPTLLCQRHRLNTKYDVCFVNRTWNYFPNTSGFPLLWTFFLRYFSASLVAIETTKWKFLEITNLTHFFMSLQVSIVTALIIRRSNCINTSSGMISLCKWLLGMPVLPAYQAVTRTVKVTAWYSGKTGIPSSHT